MANYNNIKPYAEFAHKAAQHGGVENYLNEIKESNYELGVMDERSTEGAKVAAASLLVLLVWEKVVKPVYRKISSISEKRREIIVDKSKTAEAAIIDTMQEYEEDELESECSESSEDDENEVIEEVD